MSKQDYTQTFGPSWYDVEKMMEHIQGEHHCTVQSITGLARTKNGYHILMVTTCAFRLDGNRNRIHLVQKVSQWTRSEFKTATALLFNHLNYIDAYLVRMALGEHGPQQLPMFPDGQAEQQ